MPVIAELIETLKSGDARGAPAASEALRLIGTEEVLKDLIVAAQSAHQGRNWILATLGSFPSDMVKAGLAGNPLLDEVAPMLLVSSGSTWLATEETVADIAFLRKQSLRG